MYYLNVAWLMKQCLETAERKKLDATFSVDRAEEALVRANSQKSRADIAL